LIVDGPTIHETLNALRDQMRPNVEGNYVFGESRLASSGIAFDEALEFAKSKGGDLVREPDPPHQLMGGVRTIGQPEREIEVPEDAFD
jgi:hypothetical protein